MHGDPETLTTLAQEAADQATALARSLSGHSPWAAYAEAARAEIALARGDASAAGIAGATAMQALQESLTEDVHLEALLSASQGIFVGAPPEVHGPVREWLRLTLSRIAQATVDDHIRVRWLRSPLGRELVELAGAFEPDVAAGRESVAPAHVGPLDDVDRRIARLLTEGRTNREMADELGMSEADVTEHLARVYARLGASTRAEATTLAFRGLGASVAAIAAAGMSPGPSASA
jgi:DNA-binding NarL/FixJ family response regulator